MNSVPRYAENSGVSWWAHIKAFHREEEGEDRQLSLRLQKVPVGRCCRLIPLGRPNNKRHKDIHGKWTFPLGERKWSFVSLQLLCERRCASLLSTSHRTLAGVVDKDNKRPSCTYTIWPRRTIIMMMGWTSVGPNGQRQISLRHTTHSQLQ